MKTRKELVQAYKEIKQVVGVFQVRNTLSGKTLIEVSTDVHSKINRHKRELNFGSHRNSSLQKDWKSLGADSFKFELLSELSIKENEEINVSKELKVLKELVIESLDIPGDKRY